MMNAFKTLFLLTLIGCGSHRSVKKSMLESSESPCLDGTIVNIYQAGCKSLYIGEAKDGSLLKIRCAYSPDDSFLTKATFYVSSKEFDSVYSNWFLYCEDRYTKVFSTPYGINLNNDKSNSK